MAEMATSETIQSLIISSIIFNFIGLRLIGQKFEKVGYKNFQNILFVTARRTAPTQEVSKSTEGIAVIDPSYRRDNKFVFSYLLLIIL